MAKETVIVEGTMYWNNCTEEYSYEGVPSGKFQFDLSDLSAASVDKIMSLRPKMAPKDKGERGSTITLKQSMSFTPRACVQDVEGEEVKYMPFSDKDGSPLTKEEVAVIGNGSKVRAKIGVYSTGFGRFLSYEAGRVLELIEYRPDDGLGGDLSDNVESTPTDLDDLDDDIPFGSEEV
jgi:hypothetical protein